MGEPAGLYDPEAFLAALHDEGALLGLDPGTKTIGMAISDVRRTMASPLVTLQRTRFADDVERLSKIIDQEGIVGLVVGMPINMDGTRGPRAQSVRAFRRHLSERINLPILYQDERLSTDAARTQMAETGASKRAQSLGIDAAAAQVILTDALKALDGLTLR